MAEEKTTILTESGMKKLEEQLDYLISVRRNEVSEQIAIARRKANIRDDEPVKLQRFTVERHEVK